MPILLDQRLQLFSPEVLHHQKDPPLEAVEVQLLKIDHVLVLQAFHILELPLDLIEYFLIPSPCNFDGRALLIAPLLEPADDPAGPLP